MNDPEARGRESTKSQRLLRITAAIAVGTGTVALSATRGLVLAAVVGALALLILVVILVWSLALRQGALPEIRSSSLSISWLILDKFGSTADTGSGGDASTDADSPKDGVEQTTLRSLEIQPIRQQPVSGDSQ